VTPARYDELRAEAQEIVRGRLAELYGVPDGVRFELPEQEVEKELERLVAEEVRRTAEKFRKAGAKRFGRQNSDVVEDVGDQEVGDQAGDVTVVTDVTAPRQPHSQVATAELLDDIKAYLARFVIYPSEHELNAHTLWIAHAWLMDCWESTPRIAFLGPEPGSGKSRALEVTEPVVPRPVHAVNTTPAYLFRKVSDAAGAPTILYDEIDCVFGAKAKEHEDTRGMLNAGHRKGATAGRCVVRGKSVETEELPAYCAVALAGLDDLPDTIMTRSVIVRMRRRAADEKIEPWRPRVNAPDAQKLYTRLAKWSTQARTLLSGDFWPEMPYGVEDRDADCWEALLAVADIAGDRWAKAARRTAVTHVRAAKRRPPTIGVLLLRDVKRVFDRLCADKLPTEDIINGLAKIPESPWATIRKGDPIDDRGLALRLGKYGIGSKAQRAGEDVFKGYSRTQFVDAWKRYVDELLDDDDDDPADNGCGYQDAVTAVTSVTRDNGCDYQDAVTAVTPVTPDPEPSLFATAVTAVTDSGQTNRQCDCGEPLLTDESIQSGQCLECHIGGSQ
jgi:hypothetical protein